MCLCDKGGNEHFRAPKAIAEVCAAVSGQGGSRSNSPNPHLLPRLFVHGSWLLVFESTHLQVSVPARGGWSKVGVCF